MLAIPQSFHVTLAGITFSVVSVSLTKEQALTSVFVRCYLVCHVMLLETSVTSSFIATLTRDPKCPNWLKGGGLNSFTTVVLVFIAAVTLPCKADLATGHILDIPTSPEEGRRPFNDLVRSAKAKPKHMTYM